MCKELQTNMYIANNKYTIQNNKPLQISHWSENVCSDRYLYRYASHTHCEVHCTSNLDQCAQMVYHYNFLTCLGSSTDKTFSQKQFHQVFVSLTSRLADLRAATLCNLINYSDFWGKCFLSFHQQTIERKRHTTNYFFVTGDGDLCFNTFNPDVPFTWYTRLTTGWLARVFNAHLYLSHLYHL